MTEVAVFEIHMDRNAVDHKPQNDTSDIGADQVDDIQSDTTMQVPTLNSNSNNKASDVKKNVPMTKSSSSVRQG